jgi:hypothetical protein
MERFQRMITICSVGGMLYVLGCFMPPLLLLSLEPNLKRRGGLIAARPVALGRFIMAFGLLILDLFFI